MTMLEDPKALKAQAKALLTQAAKIEAAQKFEALRPAALEAVQKLDATRLQGLLAYCSQKAGKRRGTAKATYRWDEAMGKNCKVDAEGAFIEPRVILRGPGSKVPVKG
jgi:hypothetical protein